MNKTFKLYVGLIVAGLISSVFLMASNALAYADPIELKVAEEAFNYAVNESSEENICEAERHLAWVKLNEHNEGRLGLESDDLARLGGKQNQKCVDDSETSKFTQKSYYRKITAGEDQNVNVRIASEISGNNLDFILTLEQENGLWNVDRFHGYNTNGTTDHGFCGLNSAYHSNYIGTENFLNPWHQMEYCYSIFQRNPGRFYGYFKRHKHRGKFVLVSE